MSRRSKKVTPPSKPVPANPWDGFGLVRIRHPSEPRMYYCPDGPEPWVRTGYAKWDIATWKEIYRAGYPDGRNWEFFGEVIEIWPDKQEDKR